MAKKIETIKNPVKVKKGTIQVDISKDVDRITKERLLNMRSQITKTGLNNQKIIGVFVTFDVNGNVEIVYFGAGPEIEKRAQFLSTKIADSIPVIMEAYDMPQIDMPPEKVKS